MDDVIKKIADKISSYEIFSNFIPGLLFCNFLDLTTRFNTPGELWEKLVLYYFAGMVVGRIGSICIERIFKKFVDFTPYESYVKALKTDVTIDILNQKNNFYRSMCAIFLTLSIVKLYDIFLYDWIAAHGFEGGFTIILYVLLFVLFAGSYKKQTDYVRNRVNADLNGSMQDKDCRNNTD